MARRRWRRGWWGLAPLLLFALFLALDRAFPVPLPRGDDGYAVVVTAADGTPLRAFADDQGVWRYPVTLAEVSPRYIEALINYEDRHFWQHPGVDPLALVRALGQYLYYGQPVSGGSTLTMQVARILDHTGHNVPGKLRQIFRALQLEWHLSKAQILTLYLNHAPFGGTLEGVQAASFAYLGTSAAHLSPAQAALLAILPQAPSRLRPDQAPHRAQQARDKVLARLESFHVWSPATVAAARQERVAAWPRQRPLSAPLLARRLAPQAQPGQVLRTTLDAGLQAQLESLLHTYSARLPAHSSAAVLVVDNRTLAVRAYLGSPDLLDRSRFGYIDMVQAVRSPGSTLKPFLYGIAIEDGLIHSASLLVDAPQTFDHYRPGDFSGGYAGPVTATAALRRSLNIPAVDLLERVGPDYFDARLRQGGLTLQYPTQARPNLAMILGAVGTRLENLVSTYTALARDGHAGQLRFRPGAPVRDYPLLQPGAAWIVRQMLRSPRPGAQGLAALTADPAPVAWKTGTSYGFRDAWSIGVTDRYTVGVWVGRPDGTPMPGYYGAVTAAPLMFQVFDALPTPPTMAARQPASVRKTTICWPLGTEATADSPFCQMPQPAWIYDNQVPRTLPDRRDDRWLANPVTVRVSRRSGLRLSPGCAPDPDRPVQIARWPQTALAWLPRRLRQASRLPPLDPRCDGPALDSVKITSLQPDAILRPAGDAGDWPLATLQASGGSGPIRWLLDGVQVAQTEAGGYSRYRFRHRGRHRLTALDAAGNHDSIAITVDAAGP